MLAGICKNCGETIATNEARQWVHIDTKLPGCGSRKTFGTADPGPSDSGLARAKIKGGRMAVNQDHEYTLPAVRVIAAVPDSNGNTMLYEHDAQRIVDALHDAGWALVEAPGQEEEGGTGR